MARTRWRGGEQVDVLRGDYMSVAGIARRSSVTPDVVTRMIHKGKIPALRFNGFLLVPLAEAERFIRAEAAPAETHTS